jgi:predicted transcriptional regulator
MTSEGFPQAEAPLRDAPEDQPEGAGKQADASRDDQAERAGKQADASRDDQAERAGKQADASRDDQAEGAGEQADASPDGQGRLNLTDPKAIRALAHPVRWALLEALGQAGTLTATQASEMLGESPANCAFHLRTLAKYGFVEEAGGGRGRERPWRQKYDGMSWRTRQSDPQASQAAEALDQVWMDRVMARAQRSLTSMMSWPQAFDDSLGASVSRVYVTPEEAAELYSQLRQTFERVAGTGKLLADRRDPKRRPPGAVPVEFVVLGYPILGEPPLPRDDEPDSEPGDDMTPGEEPGPSG